MLDQVQSVLSQPICAIGGINLDNAPLLLRHGVDLLAVIQALFDAPSAGEVRERAQRFSYLF